MEISSREDLPGHGEGPGEKLRLKPSTIQAHLTHQPMASEITQSLKCSLVSKRLFLTARQQLWSLPAHREVYSAPDYQYPERYQAKMKVNARDWIHTLTPFIRRWTTLTHNQKLT